MPTVDLHALTDQTRAILADPQVDPPVTGTPALDRALAAQRSASAARPARRYPGLRRPSGRRRLDASMSALGEVARPVLHRAHLPPALAERCAEALGQPGYLFSAAPVWARLFLAWSETSRCDRVILGEPRHDAAALEHACAALAGYYGLSPTAVRR